MGKSIWAVAVAAMLAAAGASAADAYGGASPCPGSESFEYVGGTLFDFDKSVPSMLEMDTLAHGYQRAVGEFKGDNYVWIYIKGSTDSVGTDEYNDALGDRRAQAVKDALSDRGVQGATVHLKSFGKRWPKYDNSTAQGRHMNRSAEVSIVSMDQAKADWCYSVHPESIPKVEWWKLP